MSQIKKAPVLFCILLSLAVFVSGCGDANPEATFDPDTGHPSGWLPAGHAARASAGIASCTECHGAALDGGISAVGCTTCHLGSATEIHPLGWGDFAYSRHGDYVEANGAVSCSNISCHGANLEGVAGSGPSCTSCHLGSESEIHPLSWGAFAYARHDEFVGTDGTTSCENGACHGPALSGVEESGPSCTSCHLGGVNSVHPTDWSSLLSHGAYATTNGLSSCANGACHGRDLMGVTESGPSCLQGISAGCHPWIP